MGVGSGVSQSTVICVGGPRHKQHALADVPHFTHVPDGQAEDGSVHPVATTGYSLHRYIYSDGSTHLYFLADHVTREELADASLPPQVAPDLLQMSDERIAAAAGKLVSLVNEYTPDGMTPAQQNEFQAALEVFARAIIIEVQQGNF